MHVRIVVWISNFQGLFLLQLATFKNTKQLYYQYQKISMSNLSIIYFSIIKLKLSMMIPNAVRFNVESAVTR